VPGQPQYRDNSSGSSTSTVTPGPYDKPNLDGAKKLLTDNGYTITGTPPVLKTKAGKAVTVNITSTQGNKLRNSEEAFVINALAPLGIVVTEKDTTGLSKTLSDHSFDMIIFAWLDTPFASGNDAIFQTKTKSTGASNYDGYANPAVNALIAQADVELDPAKQAADYNAVDALVWNDLVALPLFQKPTLLIFQTKYKNMQTSLTSEEASWNIQDWALSK
jgi:peptide/nickel transport system substrate-binding protein